MSTLIRINYIDKKGFLSNEWWPTEMTAADRVKELDTLGMEFVDMEDVELPWEGELADMIHWLNRNPNTPAGFYNQDRHAIDKVEAALTAPQAESALNVQEGGSHYKDLAIQPVQYIHANGIPFMEGCVIKYVSRHRTKNGAADLKKAAHFIQLLLELEYKET